MKNLFKIGPPVLCLLLLLLSIPARVAAQTAPSIVLRGTITDPSGRGYPTAI